MSPPTLTQGTRSKSHTSSQSGNAKRAFEISDNLRKQRALEDEFDIVEEDPDLVDSTTEDDSDTEVEPSPKPVKGKVTKPRQDGNDVPRFIPSPQESEAEQRKRIARLESTKIGIRDWYNCLDFDMLRLFWKSMFAFFFLGLVISLVFLVFVYFFNEDLWYEYFPVASDLSLNKAPSQKNKQEL